MSYSISVKDFIVENASLARSDEMIAGFLYKILVSELMIGLTFNGLPSMKIGVASEDEYIYCVLKNEKCYVNAVTVTSVDLNQILDNYSISEDWTTWIDEEKLLIRMALT